MKRIKHALFVLFCSLLIVFIGGMKIAPDGFSRWIGFRCYVVLSHSMEPKIPTYSLIWTKTIQEHDIIRKNDIVTFKAKRFGQNVLITHYLKKIEKNANGEYYYRTQGAKAQEYDQYDTLKSDIIGKYIGHIPYIGKIIAFYQSRYGRLLLMEYVVIFLIYFSFQLYWKESIDENTGQSSI